MKTRCTCNGIEYESLAAACRAVGVNAPAVRFQRCTRKTNRIEIWGHGGMHKAGAVAPYVFEWPEEGKDADV